MLVCTLNYEDGRQKSTQFTLPLTIGRAASCGLRLNSWRVARQHAVIQAGAEGIYIEDLGALAGTLVNGRRVAVYGPLCSGNEIIIGPCRLLIQQVPEAGKATTKPAFTAVHGASKTPRGGSAATAGVREESVLASSALVGEPGLPLRLHPSSQAEAFQQNTNTSEASNLSQKAEKITSQALDSGQALSSAALNEPAMSDAVVLPVEALPNNTLRHRQRLHRALLEALDLRRRDIASLSDQALRAEASRVLSAIIEQDNALEPETDRQLLLQELVNEAVGLGPLEPLLADSSITEIMVNRFDEIFVETGGLLKRHASVFSSEQAVQAVIERIVSPLGRRIDESSPMVDARLADGSRVNAVIPPVALRGASLTIRKFPSKRPVMEDLLSLGALSPAMQAFLQACVIDRKNIVVSGGTGSGKTTLLNILSNYIPSGERIVTIEDAAELQLNHAHLVTLEARPANLEGRGRIEIRDLVRNALRMRPDRIVIGECRGSEAFDMLAAMNTGHEGSLTTLHANSPRDALSRLETMILMAGMDLPLSAVREHIAASIDLIVQQVRSFDGRRLINSIVEVSGIESGRVQTQTLFSYEEGSPGWFSGSGLIPELLSHGGSRALRQLDIQLFSSRTARAVCRTGSAFS